jgi:hypothetical protein
MTGATPCLHPLSAYRRKTRPWRAEGDGMAQEKNE